MSPHRQLHLIPLSSHYFQLREGERENVGIPAKFGVKNNPSSVDTDRLIGSWRAGAPDSHRVLHYPHYLWLVEWEEEEGGWDGSLELLSKPGADRPVFCQRDQTLFHEKEK